MRGVLAGEKVDEGAERRGAIAGEEKWSTERGRGTHIYYVLHSIYHRAYIEDRSTREGGEELLLSY